MNSWANEEDLKYSWLYSNGYPIGDPIRLTRIFNISKTKSCIDLGCGRARLSKYFSDYTGVDVSEYVINLNKKNRSGNYFHMSLDEIDISTNYDVAICSDVMEHIPPNEVENVLSSIANLKVPRFYFAISTRKSVILDRHGRNLHLTVWPSDVWKDKLSKYFLIMREEKRNTLYSVECSSLQNNSKG